MLKKYGSIVFVFSILLIACSSESEDELMRVTVLMKHQQY